MPSQKYGMDGFYPCLRSDLLQNQVWCSVTAVFCIYIHLTLVCSVPYLIRYTDTTCIWIPGVNQIYRLISSFKLQLYRTTISSTVSAYWTDAGEYEHQLLWGSPTKEPVQQWGEGWVIVQWVSVVSATKTDNLPCAKSFFHSALLSHTLTNTQTQNTDTLKSMHNAKTPFPAKSLWACWCVRRSWVQVPV